MNKIKRYIRFNFMNCQKLKFSMAFFASGKKKGQLFIFIKANLVWKDDEGDVRSAPGHRTIDQISLFTVSSRSVPTFVPSARRLVTPKVLQPLILISPQAFRHALVHHVCSNV